jgi:hypothetical protein
MLAMMYVSSFAQNDSLSQEKWRGRVVPKATLKINVSALANIFRSSLFVAGDIYITKHVVVDVGAGWFFGSILQGYKGETMNGYRQRLGFKYMFLPERKVSPYIGVEGKLNYIVQKDIETISRFNNQYTEIAHIPRKIQNYGAAIRAGIHVIPDRQRRFIIDIYSGFGYKYTGITQKLPADAQIFSSNQDFLFERGAGNYHDPDFLFGFSLGYCFH